MKSAIGIFFDRETRRVASTFARNQERARDRPAFEMQASNVLLTQPAKPVVVKQAEQEQLDVTVEEKEDDKEEETYRKMEEAYINSKM